MWSRAELKERAKIAFKRNYWSCVLVAFILSIFSGSGTGAANSFTNFQTDEIVEEYNYYEDDGILYDQDDLFDHNMVQAVRIGLVTIIMVAGVIGIVVGIFILNPLEIGGCYFFANNTYENASAWDLVAGFKNGRYWKSVGIVFLRNLYIALWGLLFVIPGVIKSYEYYMVTYLIAEFPDMSKEEAFRLSKEMMKGHKMDTFVLELSFIGWYILTALTCGILGLFYVTPYVHATRAELYITLRKNIY